MGVAGYLQTFQRVGLSFPQGWSVGPAGPPET